MKRPSAKTSMFKEIRPITKLDDIPRIKQFNFFRKKGIKCVKCGCEGKFIVKDALNRRKICTENYISLNRDHIIPASKGGADALANMQTMCEYCNRLKGTMNNDIFLAIPNCFLDDNFKCDRTKTFKVFILMLRIMAKFYRTKTKIYSRMKICTLLFISSYERICRQPKNWHINYQNHSTLV